MRRIPRVVCAAAVLAVIALTPAAGAASVPSGQVRHAIAARRAPLTLVGLGATFTPSAVRLRAGQLLLIAVGRYVSATVTSPRPGGPLTGGELSDGLYLFTVTGTGTATIAATVRPRCLPEIVCPQWITAPKLTVTAGP